MTGIGIAEMNPGPDLIAPEIIGACGGCALALLDRDAASPVIRGLKVLVLVTPKGNVALTRRLHAWW